MTTVETNPKVPIILIRNALSSNNNLTDYQQKQHTCQSPIYALVSTTLYSFCSLSRNPIRKDPVEKGRIAMRIASIDRRHQLANPNMEKSGLPTLDLLP